VGFFPALHKIFIQTCPSFLELRSVISSKSDGIVIWPWFSLLKLSSDVSSASDVIVITPWLGFQILVFANPKYEGVSKSFRTGNLEQELQMLQLSATRCSGIAILWVSLVNFATITLCVPSQRVFIVVVIIYFVVDSVRKLLDTPSYITWRYG
jgi:hypothetical protein